STGCIAAAPRRSRDGRLQPIRIRTVLAGRVQAERGRTPVSLAREVLANIVSPTATAGARLLAASRQVLQPTRAGDRGRTGDVQVGKLSGPCHVGRQHSPTIGTCAHIATPLWLAPEPPTRAATL